MATITRFEDIEARKLARVLYQRIRALTMEPGFSRDFALVDQIRRASVSVMANIAEGFERDGNREFCRFLYVAKGSLGEVRSHLYAALDAGYIDVARHDELQREAEMCGKTIAGFIRYLEHTDKDGRKLCNTPSR